MDNFYKQDGIDNEKNSFFIKKLEIYIKNSKSQFYLINKPQSEQKYSYDYEKGVLVLLVPKHKIMFIDIDEKEDEFKSYEEDFIEDLGVLSDKFNYKEYIGRPRIWKELISYDIDKNDSIEKILTDNRLIEPNKQKKCELLISLLTGSINDIKKVKGDIPNNILDKVKQKIVLFDGDQTRFIYQKKDKKIITIQGLSGTGKTELLLHKLKELYTSSTKPKIMFTCHNKILSSSLKERIPKFFNFMKVEKQIEWNKRLWVVNAWGSRQNIHSGAYRYICDFYDINFYVFKDSSFDNACKIALNEIQKEENFRYAFDYILIDEGQDFPKSFFELCAKVTKISIYVVGDIFQNIFQTNIGDDTDVDYLLNKCYKTDPKTLMFAHSIGMGLFEEKKINWLSDKGWKDCGYNIRKENNRYLLNRTPLRRFEDLNNNDNFESVKLIKNDDGTLVETVINTLNKIKEENLTVQADDIAIIFIGSNKKMYQIVDVLERIIYSKFNWDINKVYETKKQIKDNLFVSNNNNVKGLEFPFIICIIDNLKNDLKFRNSLYMMLTRSFIQSYLLIKNSDKIESIKSGLKNINENGYIKTKIPTDLELENIKQTVIKYNEDCNKSWKDFLSDILDECQVRNIKDRANLENMININSDLKNNFNREKLMDFIQMNMNFFGRD